MPYLFFTIILPDYPVEKLYYSYKATLNPGKSLKKINVSMGKDVTWKERFVVPYSSMA